MNDDIEEIILDKDVVEVVVRAFFRVMDDMLEESGGEGFHMDEDDMVERTMREVGV